MSLKYAILAALSSQPRTGYELSKKIHGSIGFFWSATHQQIYKELKELDSEGWVSVRAVRQSEKPDKKIYRLSSRGVKELKKWIAEEAHFPAAKDALLIKIFAGHLVPPAVLMNVLEKAATHRKKRLKQFQEIMSAHFTELDSLSEAHQFQYLTLRRGILFEQAWLRWAEETRKFLQETKRAGIVGES